METTMVLPHPPAATEEKAEDGGLVTQVEEFMSTLPVDEQWTKTLYLYKGFWHPKLMLPGTLAAERHLVARPDDIFIASSPKSGTTWLKALVFSIVHRRRHRPGDPSHPLRAANPHDRVPFVEDVFAANPDAAAALGSPRVWSVHTPFSALPASLRDGGCRLVYVAREPKDVFVSHFLFKSGIGHYASAAPLAMEAALELFCEGICPYGPIWEHALEYWNESVRRPEKVLFLRYEEMKADALGTVRRLADFLGCPFSEEEEDGEGEGSAGLPAEIAELCSFRGLSGLAVNKEGDLEALKGFPIPRKLLFRRGEIGDWKNHLSPEMAEKVDMIGDQKMRGTGFSFHY